MLLFKSDKIVVDFDQFVSEFLVFVVDLLDLMLVCAPSLLHLGNSDFGVFLKSACLLRHHEHRLDFFFIGSPMLCILQSTTCLRALVH